jgi:hypothetical protein
MTVNNGAVAGPFLTVTELLAVAVRPSVACASTLRVCAPSSSVVVSSVPAGSSPLNWYGAMRSVHFTVPSIRKSTELTVVPLGVAVQVSEPLSVAPSAIVEVTSNDDGVAPLATVTALVVVAVRPSAAWAWRASVWAPSLSVVVSSLLPSPLKT